MLDEERVPVCPMEKEKTVAPVVKWVGGKRQLLDTLLPLLPQEPFPVYCEPFLGGGALLFRIQPEHARVNDINSDLILVYETIRDNVEALISTLQTFRNDRESFYEIRSLDRDPEKYSRLSSVQKAARLIYLNKTCYNGLYRVNNAGQFNSPFGNYKKPNIVNAEVLRGVSEYFNRAEVVFSSEDYASVLDRLPANAFVYLDPPYDPVSETANFTGYAQGGFGREQQIRLREQCDELTRRNIRFMLSNSATDFIKEQYANYHITVVKAKRAINSDSTKRGHIDEVVVRNYE